MKKRGIVLVCLCLAVIIGSTGCNLIKKTAKEDKLTDEDIEEIGELMEDYVDALRNWEYEPLYDLTTLDLDGKDSWLPNSIQMQRDAEPGSERADEFEYCKYIASTIEADYDLDDLEFDNGKAFLEVDFSTVYWAEVSWQEYKNANGMVSDLKRTDKKEHVSDEITFKKVDGEWKITRTESLFDLLLFYCNTPRLSGADVEYTDYVETEPEVTQTFNIVPVTEEQYINAMDYNHYELYISQDNIEAFEERYFEESCGDFDFDGNGATESIYFGYMEDYGPYFSITVYDPEADGVYFCYNTLPDACIDPDGDGSFVMYVTDNGMVVTYSYEEDGFYKCETIVYNKIFFPDSYYRYEKDLSTGSENYYTNFIQGLSDDDVISAGEYETVIGNCANSANVIVYNKGFAPGSCIEAPQASITYDEWRTRDEMSDYYESIIDG